MQVHPSEELAHDGDWPPTHCCEKARKVSEAMARLDEAREEAGR